MERAAQALGLPGAMQRLAQATNNFQVYTWWNELPFVHIATAQRMFQSWANYLKTADSSLTRSQRKSSSCQHCDVLTSMIPHMQFPTSSIQRDISATSVSGSMGAGHGEAMETAGRAFEHIVYQLYTVSEGSYRVKDLTSSIHNKDKLSLLERFWCMGEEDRKTVINTIHPLWLPFAWKNDTTLEGKKTYDYHEDREFPSVLLNFHLDRNPCM
mmetsp:Transcript_78412/g.210456  ORF Transcript_78412/g.210456 Transcript_78412/m.210456 type:complete len:213 (+) Transcript_78412:549-1187(+)